jgi:hypothetical protein
MSVAARMRGNRQRTDSNGGYAAHRDLITGLVSADPGNQGARPTRPRSGQLGYW